MSILQTTQVNVGNNVPHYIIAYTELDDEMRVIRGQVLAHSPDRDEIYRKLLSVRGQQVAVEYMGEVPEDLAVVL